MNGSNYLINKILRVLDNNNLTIVGNINQPNIFIDEKIQDNIIRKHYSKAVISLDYYTLTHIIDNYTFLPYILDKILLELTSNISTKNHYFTKETINEDLQNIINNPQLKNINWYVTLDTHLAITSITGKFSTNDNNNNTVLKIDDKEIKILDSSFPNGAILGTSYPILINNNEVFESYDTSSTSALQSYNINLTFYYINEFHAIKMITDEKQKKIFLRQRKLKKLNQILKHF